VARTRSFDPAVALEDAMELFWAKGYEATSLDDLVAHTGVARAGLYAAFGDKHGLYVKALEHYIARRNAASEELLLRTPGGLAGVRELIRRYAAEKIGGDRRGCLVVNAAIGLGSDDHDVAALIRQSWKATADAISQALAAAQLAGDVRADRDPQSLAQMVLVFLQGMRVLARVETPREDVERGVTETMRALEE